MSLTGDGTFKPAPAEYENRNGETGYFSINKDYLPGEFVLRFDYRDQPTSMTYPCEKRLFIGNQDLELRVNPKYCNNSDSTYFQEGELENNAFSEFAEGSYRRKEQLGLLQQLLMNYDDPGSGLYKKTVREYEDRRREFNKWLVAKKNDDSSLFVSSLYMFEYIPETDWSGSGKERLISATDHYFDGVDLSDPAITRTSYFTRWIDAYVNMHGQMATTVALRDSLFPEAARKAIEQGRKGHPEVYGWMVDYFYRGFETNNIPAGIKALEPYINGPFCLTSKRKEIERRLKGLETLVRGSAAPDIELEDNTGHRFGLYSSDCSSPYLLLLFWSAGCNHCKEVIEGLYPWQQDPLIRSRLSVVAISLDETANEVEAWKNASRNYGQWIHLLATEGVRSKVASDYFILSTPQMILLDGGTKKIIDMPAGLPELKSLVQAEALTADKELQ